MAGRADEEELRQLLRGNAIDGWIRLAFAREPDALAAAAIMGPLHGYVIARNLHTHEPVGVCEWSARECFIDGEPRLLAYLGALRVAARYRHRLSVLRGRLHGRPATVARRARDALCADRDRCRQSRRVAASGATCRVYHELSPLKSFSTFTLRPRGG